MAKLKITPGRLDIEIVRGASFDKTITLTKDGVAVDLTTYTKAKLQVREDADSDTVTDEYATTTAPPDPSTNSRPGSIVLGGSAGTIRLIAPPDILEDYPDTAAWDIALYKDDGTTWKPLGGNFTFVDGVTR